MSRRPHAFWAVVFAGGLVFGLGLAASRMVRPEVVLAFLRLEDFGLLLVMGAAAVTLGLGMRVVPAVAERAPITGASYGRRRRDLDRDVLVGGAVFGAGWGLSGVCPGAAYASFGVGNWPILWAVAGMFVGAYAQGYWRSDRTADPAAPTAD